jgi:hypothetical protein
LHCETSPALPVLLQVSGGVAGQSLSFSSYPGELASDDDFYMTSSKLVVLETTNHIYNFSILEVRAQGCSRFDMSRLWPCASEYCHDVALLVLANGRA